MIFRGSRHIAFAHACKTFPARLPLDLRSLSTVNRNSALHRSMAMTTPAKPTTPAVDFNDADMAFRQKTLWEIVRALLVFQISSIKPLVKHSDTVMASLDRIFTKPVVDWLLKVTFFGHFCAGEDGVSIQPTVQKLKSAHIGSILDYAAEADVGDERRQDIHVDRNELQSRTYDYTGELECDKNTEITLKAIEAAKDSKGFAAVKMTALGKPEFLQHLSMILNETRGQFSSFHAEAGVPAPATLTLDAFRGQAQKFRAGLSDDEIEALFKVVDVDGSGCVDFIEWLDYVEPLRLCMVPVEDPRHLQFLAPGSRNTMTQNDITRFANMLRRLDCLADAAKQAGVTLMVDAEQTYLQPAIDHSVQYMQRRYNQERAVVYNTIQCYLMDSFGKLELSLRRAKRHGVKYGVKLVRGAYLVQETKLAEERGYPSPIWPKIQDTHDNYHACMRKLLDNLDVAEFMVASHNEDSVRLAIAEMAKRGIDPETGGVSFGQLLGMCDHVSFPLGAAGYRSYKYVPYGPVREVMPYLMRRAQENGDMLGRVGHERSLLFKALRSRLSF